MGCKKFPFIDIRGDQVKPRWTRWLLLLIGFLLPPSAIYTKSPIGYRWKLTSSWKPEEVLLVPRLTIGKLTSSREPLASLLLTVLRREFPYQLPPTPWLHWLGLMGRGVPKHLRLINRPLLEPMSLNGIGGSWLICKVTYGTCWLASFTIMSITSYIVPHPSINSSPSFHHFLYHALFFILRDF